MHSQQTQTCARLRGAVHVTSDMQSESSEFRGGGLFLFICTFKTIQAESALAGVAQWIERRPVHPKIHKFESRLGHMSGL